MTPLPPELALPPPRNARLKGSQAFLDAVIFISSIVVTVVLFAVSYAVQGRDSLVVPLLMLGLPFAVIAYLQFRRRHVARVARQGEPVWTTAREERESIVVSFRFREATFETTPQNVDAYRHYDLSRPLLVLCDVDDPKRVWIYDDLFPYVIS